MTCQPERAAAAHPAGWWVFELFRRHLQVRAFRARCLRAWNQHCHRKATLGEVEALPPLWTRIPFLEAGEWSASLHAQAPQIQTDKDWILAWTNRQSQELGINCHLIDPSQDWAHQPKAVLPLVGKWTVQEPEPEHPLLRRWGDLEAIFPAPVTIFSLAQLATSEEGFCILEQIKQYQSAINEFDCLRATFSNLLEKSELQLLAWSGTQALWRHFPAELQWSCRKLASQLNQPDRASYVKNAKPPSPTGDTEDDAFLRASGMLYSSLQTLCELARLARTLDADQTSPPAVEKPRAKRNRLTEAVAELHEKFSSQISFLDGQMNERQILPDVPVSEQEASGDSTWYAVFVDQLNEVLRKIAKIRDLLKRISSAQDIKSPESTKFMHLLDKLRDYCGVTQNIFIDRHAPSLDFTEQESEYPDQDMERMPEGLISLDNSDIQSTRSLIREQYFMPGVQEDLDLHRQWLFQQTSCLAVVIRSGIPEKRWMAKVRTVYRQMCVIQSSQEKKADRSRIAYKELPYYLGMWDAVAMITHRRPGEYKRYKTSLCHQIETQLKRVPELWEYWDKAMKYDIKDDRGARIRQICARVDNLLQGNAAQAAARLARFYLIT